MAITTNGKVSITNLQVGSSADLASIISDESGTGVLAFTNSPSFTTPALGTPSAVTLTNGTGLPVSGITASTSAALGVGTIELGHATDTTIARGSAGVVTIEGVNVVTTSSTDTLTNKTINGSNNTITNVAISTAVSGLGTGVATFLATPSSTNLISAITDETGTGALVFANTPTLVTPVLGTPTSGTLTNCTGLPVSGISASTTTALGVGSIELGHASDTTLARVSAGVVSIEGVNVVTTSSTDTLTNKTLTSPSINGAHTNLTKELIVQGLEERVNVVASAATGTINIDVATSSIWYYTSNATANHTLNFRYNSGTSLSSKLAVGDAITLVWMNTNGTTAYYPNTIQIDGSAVTPKVPAAISAGNASAIDVYTFTIIKTAATPTYTVLETQQKFA
jgi:hypothetical protein